MGCKTAPVKCAAIPRTPILKSCPSGPAAFPAMMNMFPQNSSTRHSSTMQRDTQSLAGCVLTPLQASRRQEVLQCKSLYHVSYMASTTRNWPNLWSSGSTGREICCLSQRFISVRTEALGLWSWPLRRVLSSSMCRHEIWQIFMDFPNTAILRLEGGGNRVSESLVNTYQITRCHILENNNNFHICTPFI